ncbi:MAG TPA: DUF1826 domain-containing protein [Candidatus Competibacter phosphatis]|nr:DUF1826 domain-containing protein [Candidatus Competibacter phosphatis]HMR02991.1 DUF1826 domain-containing protein [Candidatus Competibacter phosphatis]
MMEQPRLAETNRPQSNNTLGNGDAQDAGVLFGYSPDLFQRIHDTDVELIIWERPLACELGRWLEALPVDQLPNRRVLVLRADLRPALTVIFDAAGTPGGAMRDALLDDLIRLATLFMDTLDSGRVDIRLETVQHDACWKFHRDNVAARLVTTYRGPGTQWVRPHDNAMALAVQKSYQGIIQHFPKHAVGLFKGSRAGPASGIVHRSPPISGSGVVRLLLCLNLPSAASPDLWTSS